MPKLIDIYFPWSFGDSTFFNPSIFKIDQQLKLMLRVGHNRLGLAVCDIDDNFQPITELTPIVPNHRKCNLASEDPRVFWYNQTPHVAFIGLEGSMAKPDIHQMYARLDDTGHSCVQTFHPHYDYRASVEKNWSFFENNDQLYAIYSLCPFRVLKIDKESTVTVTYADWRPIWNGGLLRGGAAPILVDDEYYCFFHGYKHTPNRSIRFHYYGGCFTFSAEYPFRPSRLAPHPILFPEGSAVCFPDKDIIYPAGAIFDNNRFVISCGSQDVSCKIAIFDRKDIENELKPIKSCTLMCNYEVLNGMGYFSDRSVDR